MKWSLLPAYPRRGSLSDTRPFPWPKPPVLGNLNRGHLLKDSRKERGLSWGNPFQGPQERGSRPWPSGWSLCQPRRGPEGSKTCTHHLPAARPPGLHPPPGDLKNYQLLGQSSRWVRGEVLSVRQNETHPSTPSQQTQPSSRVSLGPSTISFAFNQQIFTNRLLCVRHRLKH